MCAESPKDIFIKGERLEGWVSASQDYELSEVKVKFKDGRIEYYFIDDVKFKNRRDPCMSADTIDLATPSFNWRCAIIGWCVASLFWGACFNFLG